MCSLQEFLEEFTNNQRKILLSDVEDNLPHFKFRVLQAAERNEINYNLLKNIFCVISRMHAVMKKDRYLLHIPCLDRYAYDLIHGDGELPQRRIPPKEIELYLNVIIEYLLELPFTALTARDFENIISLLNVPIGNRGLWLIAKHSPSLDESLLQRILRIIINTPTIRLVNTNLIMYIMIIKGCKIPQEIAEHYIDLVSKTENLANPQMVMETLYGLVGRDQQLHIRSIITPVLVRNLLFKFSENYSNENESLIIKILLLMDNLFLCDPKTIDYCAFRSILLEMFHRDTLKTHCLLSTYCSILRKCKEREEEPTWFIMRCFGYARDPSYFYLVLDLYEIYLENVDNYKMTLLYIYDSNVFNYLIYAEGLVLDIMPYRCMIIKNHLEDVIIGLNEDDKIKYREDMPNAFKKFGLIAKGELQLFKPNTPQAEIILCKDELNLLVEAIHLSLYKTSEVFRFLDDSNKLVMETLNSDYTIEIDSTPCLPFNQIIVKGFTTIGELKVILHKHFALETREFTIHTLNLSSDIARKNLGKFIKEDDLNETTISIIDELYPSTNGAHFVFLDNQGNLLYPSDIICDLYPNPINPILMSICISPNLNVITVTLTNKQINTLKLNDITDIINIPLLEYIKKLISVSTFKSSYYSYKQIEYGIGVNLLSLLTTFNLSSWIYKIYDLFEPFLDTQIKRELFAYHMMSSCSKIEKCLKYTKNKDLHINKPRLHLSIDSDATFSTYEPLLRLLLSNTAFIELSYSTDVIRNVVSMNSIYCQAGLSLYNTIFGETSITKMPLPQTNPSYLTSLGVLLARCLYHNIGLSIDINKRFFQLMFTPSIMHREDYLYLKKVDYLLYDAILEGKYDSPDVYPNNHIDKLIYINHPRPILASSNDRMKYVMDVASWVCGFNFQLKFMKYFLMGWLSVFPRKVSLDPFSYKDFAFTIRGSEKIFRVTTILKSFDFTFSHKRVQVYETLIIETLAKLNNILQKAFIHMVTGITLTHAKGFSCRNITPRINIFVDQNHKKTEKDVKQVPISADVANHKLIIKQYKTKEELEGQLYQALSAHQQNRMQ